MTDQNCGSILVGGKGKHACTCRCAHAQSIRKSGGHLPHTYTRSTLIPGDPTAIVFYESEECAYRSESNEPRPTTEQSFAVVHVQHPRKKETQAPQTKSAASAPAASHQWNSAGSCCLTRVPPPHPCLAHVVPGCCRTAAWSLQPPRWSDEEHRAPVPRLGKRRYPGCSGGAPPQAASAGSGTSGNPG